MKKVICWLWTIHLEINFALRFETTFRRLSVSGRTQDRAQVKILSIGTSRRQISYFVFLKRRTVTNLAIWFVFNAVRNFLSLTMACYQYRCAHNHTNNEIKKAKRKYFTTNLHHLLAVNHNLEKKWDLINNLFSRHPNKVKNISKNKIREQPITKSPAMAEVLNLYFSSIGERLASELPSFNIEPESYIEPTETTFSMKAPAVNVDCKLLRKLN